MAIKMYINADELAKVNDVYTKTQTDTLLAAKQDTLVSGTNIKTINNESVLGSGNIVISGGSTDYNDLDNTPIINQDLDDVSFTPTANTYYRHTGASSGYGLFEINNVLLNGWAIHFDTTMGDSLARYITARYQESASQVDLVSTTPDVFGLIIDYDSNNDSYCLFIADDDIHPIYATGNGFAQGVNYYSGWQNIDANWNYILSLSSTTTIVGLDNTFSTINGGIVGIAGDPSDVIINGAIYYYDGIDYKIINGSKGLTSVTASDVNSESATNGQVLTADGNGGASWQNAGSSDVIIDLGTFNISQSGLDIYAYLPSDKKAQIEDTSVNNVYIKVQDGINHTTILLKRTKYIIIDPDDNPNQENTEICFVGSVVSDDYNKFNQRYVLYYVIDYSDYPTTTTGKALLYYSPLGTVSDITIDNSTFALGDGIKFGSDFTYDFNASEIKLAGGGSSGGTQLYRHTITGTDTNSMQYTLNVVLKTNNVFTDISLLCLEMASFYSWGQMEYNTGNPTNILGVYGKNIYRIESVMYNGIEDVYVDGWTITSDIVTTL